MFRKQEKEIMPVIECNPAVYNSISESPEALYSIRISKPEIVMKVIKLWLNRK